MIHYLYPLISKPDWQQRIFLLHSNEHSNETLLALGVDDEWIASDLHTGTLSALQTWLQGRNDWVFGYITYDVKNAIEKLQSRLKDKLQFPPIHFVRPKVVIRFSTNHLVIEKNLSTWSDHEMKSLLSDDKQGAGSKIFSVKLKPRLNKREYVEAVEHLKRRIHLGDIYEVNYCQEFFANEHIENPYCTWLRLNEFTGAPFSAYMQTGDKYALCASPERFLKKENKRIVSQPIKGTVKRGIDKHEDEVLKRALHESEKERSENVMIVDLVRNDLSRIAARGSVKVDELFGIHTFKTVHHMISTISAELKSDVTFADVLKATFPMGSMTGAPKVSAMKLIDEWEYTARGLYSGSIGYISPDGNFDFNVVIRTILYNDSLPYISCSVGSAITSLCNPEKEYEECLLKAEALMRALQ